MSLKKGDLVQLNIEGITYNLRHNITRSAIQYKPQEIINSAILQKNNALIITDIFNGSYYTYYITNCNAIPFLGQSFMSNELINLKDQNKLE